MTSVKIDISCLTCFDESWLLVEVMITFVSGDVVQPQYTHLYSVFSRSSIGTSAYGLLTGRRYVFFSTLDSSCIIVCTLYYEHSLDYLFCSVCSTLYASGTSLPMKLPWIVIPWREYWRLCHNSILACRKHKY